MKVEFRAAWGLMDFCRALDGSGVWLSDAARLRAVGSAQKFMLAYMRLAERAHFDDKPLYYFRPKLHLFAHRIVRPLRLGSRLNPNVTSAPLVAKRNVRVCYESFLTFECCVCVFAQGLLGRRGHGWEIMQ
jgi:hypothetical protein